MKIIKILLSLLMIFIGFIFIGEYTMFYVDDFMNELPTTTIYHQKGIDHNEMKEEIIKNAKNYNVSFFVVKDNIISSNEKDMIIYTSDLGVRDFLLENKNIEEKKYISVFMGSTNIIFSDYTDIDDEELELNSIYYLIGSKENIKSFKMTLIDKYAGNHPNFPNIKYKYEYSIYVIWGVIFCFSLLLTFVYVEFLKKEVSLKVIYGENVWAIIIKELSVDFLIISLFSFLIQSLLKNYTNNFRSDIFYLFLLVFVCLNSLIYIIWKRFKVGNIYKNTKNLGQITSLLYFVKLLSLILVTLILTSNILMIKESLEFLFQEDFFKEHKDYYYTNIAYISREMFDGSKSKGLEESAYIKEVFYRKNFEYFEPIILVDLGKLNSNELVMSNKYSLDYLAEKINGLKSKDLENKYYYMIPKTIQNYSSVIDLLDLQMQNYDEESNLKGREIIYYDDKVNILTIDDMLPLGSRFSKNPIIILNNRDIEFISEDIKGYPFKTTYDRDIMYKIDEDEFNKFIDEYKLKTEIHSKTNVYEKYKNGKLIMYRMLKMASVLSIILIFFELMVLLTLVKLEFRLNSYKIALKKIFGYSMWERYVKLFVFSILAILISQIIFIIINNVIELNVSYILGSVIIFLLFLVEQIIVYIEIKKVEKQNINLVLKGEFQ